MLALRVQANAKSADIVANLLASTGAADTPAQRASAGCSPAPGATGAPADRVLLQRTGERDAQPAAERVSAAAADLEPAAQRCAPAATCSGRTVEPSEYSTGGPRSPSAATLDASVDALPPGHTAGADVSASARAAAAKTPARCSAPGEAPDSADDGEAAAQVADDSGAAGGPELHTEGEKVVAALPAPCSAGATASVHTAASSGAAQQLSPTLPAHLNSGAEAALPRAPDPGRGAVARDTGAVETEAASAGWDLAAGAADGALAAEEGVAAPAGCASGAVSGSGAAIWRASCSTATPGSSAPAGGRATAATGQPAAAPPAQEAAGEGSSVVGPAAAAGRAPRSESDAAAASALEVPELARAFERGAPASRTAHGWPVQVAMCMTTYSSKPLQQVQTFEIVLKF